MAWYAKMEALKDGLKGKETASDTFVFADLDIFDLLPAKEDQVLVSFEFGDKNHDVDGRDFLVWQRGGNYQPDADNLTTPPSVENKPSLIVKFDIGGPPGSVEPDLDLA
jgi:hypothetical protein